MMGTLVANAFSAIDPDPESDPEPYPTSGNSTSLANTSMAVKTRQSSPSTFFLFPDLSIRQLGLYKLRFQLVRVDATTLLAPGNRTSEIITIAWSKEFRVYAAKDFPGMRASTKLTIGLKKAGAGISVKKGAGGAPGAGGGRHSRRRESEDEDENDGDGDEEDTQARTQTEAEEATTRGKSSGKGKKRERQPASNSESGSDEQVEEPRSGPSPREIRSKKRTWR